MLQQRHNVHTVPFEDRTLTQVEGMKRQGAQSLSDCAAKARKKARANAMGYVAKAQVEAGGLNLILNDWFERLDLVRPLDRVAQQLVRQDPGRVFEFFRFGRRKQLAGRRLGHGKQCSLNGLRHRQASGEIVFILLGYRTSRENSRATFPPRPDVEDPGIVCRGSPFWRDGGPGGRGIAAAGASDLPAGPGGARAAIVGR